MAGAAVHVVPCSAWIACYQGILQGIFKKSRFPPPQRLELVRCYEAKIANSLPTRTGKSRGKRDRSDIGVAQGPVASDVRFTPESGHVQSTTQCLLRANRSEEHTSELQSLR